MNKKSNRRWHKLRSIFKNAALASGLIFIMFGMYQFVRSEQQVSHFHSTAAFPADQTSNVINIPAFIHGQYKTVGKAFVVGRPIRISALMYLRDTQQYQQLKAMMSNGSLFVIIENSESPDSYSRDITDSLRTGEINKYFTNPGFITANTFNDKNQTLLMEGDVIFTKEGQLTFGMPLKPILDSYHMKVEGVTIAPSYAEDQIQANRLAVLLASVSAGASLISLFIALYLKD